MCSIRWMWRVIELKRIKLNLLGLGWIGDRRMGWDGGKEDVGWRFFFFGFLVSW